ncbi:asparagine--tRNA ligase, cytoplasmic, partial [Paramuricea clavata]
TLYSSEKFGCDESGDGSENKPFKTALKAMEFCGKEPFPKIMVDSKEKGMKFEEISKAQLKKLTKIFQQEQRKSDKREEKEVWFADFFCIFFNPLGAKAHWHVANIVESNINHTQSSFISSDVVLLSTK